MILVDTSVWVRHLNSEVRALSALLDAGEVSSHPFILGEIALGNLRRRDALLNDLRLLHQAAIATHDEVLDLIERQKLFGRGIGFVDAHLLAAARLSEGMRLWTFDKKLSAAATQLDIAFAG